LILAGIGLVVGGATALALGWIYTPVAAWAAICVAYLIRVWRGIWRLGARETALHATREDPGHTVMDVMLVAAAIASLIDLVGVLAASRSLPAPVRTAHAGAAVVSVALSWALIHTLFTLRYARLYHQKSAGLSFNQADAPNYWDFAYVAFSIGMTYQVADTPVDTQAMRREVFRHALLSYLFGTLILAAAVNLLVALVGR
jgi:uncharacterized membrane protein